MRSVARLFALFPLLVLGTTSGCEAAPTMPTSRVHTLQRISLGDDQAGTEYFVGMMVAFQVRALDQRGRSVPGVELRFVRPLRATVSSSSAVTDSAGLARGILSITDAGPFGVDVEVNGLAEPIVVGAWAEVRRRVEFGVDTLRFVSIGDRGEVFAQVLEPNGALIIGESVVFSASSPGIVSFYEMSYSGSTRGMRAGVRAEGLGRTAVIATHRSGVADTIVVQVGP